MTDRRRYQRVVFIEPKSTHIHVYSSVHIPRIGSILLASLMRERGHDVAVIVEDMLRSRVTEDMVWEQIRTADLLCVSTITPTVGRCYMWSDRARAAGIPVLIGGTHASYFPDESIQHADWALRGECDETFPMFVEALEADGDLSAIPGLTWKDGGEVRHNTDGKLPGAKVLESLPFPDYGLIWEANIHNGVASFAVARGCPFDCSFCSVTKFNGAAIRTVSAERTLDMIEEHWRRYRPHYIFFAEDIFNQLRTRAKTIMRGLIDRKIRPRIGFGAQMRHEVVKDAEFLDLMREAKFDRAMVGFESVNQASLDLCGKRESVEQVSHAIREFHKHGVKVHGMFVAGFDTDVPQTFKDTLKFAKKHHLDSLQLMLLTPLPGTRDWHQEGYADGTRPLLTHDWSKYDGHHALTVPKLMTAYEANVNALKTMASFYSLPRAVGRLLKGDLVEFTMRLGAWNLIRQWFKVADNRNYLEMLKTQLAPRSAGDAAPSVTRSIIIAHTAASIVLKEKLDKFFGELGIRVEHSREGLGELLTQGQTRLGEARSRISDFLADHRLFDRKSADIVLVPTDCGSEVNISAEDLGSEVPLLVRLNINGRASVLAQQCVQVAMRYSDDLKAVAEAFRRAMIETPQAAMAPVGNI